jgi:hypothetical protein
MNISGKRPDDFRQPLTEFGETRAVVRQFEKEKLFNGL